MTDVWASWRLRHESQQDQHHFFVRALHRTFASLVNPLAEKKRSKTFHTLAWRRVFRMFLTRLSLEFETLDESRISSIINQA